jgi:hypothetical protein
VGYVERVIYKRYHITLTGSVPVQSASGKTKLPFRIEGEIDRKAVRSRPQRCVRKMGGGEQHRSVMQLRPAQTNHWPRFDRCTPRHWFAEQVADGGSQEGKLGITGEDAGRDRAGCSIRGSVRQLACSEGRVTVRMPKVSGVSQATSCITRAMNSRRNSASATGCAPRRTTISLRSGTTTRSCSRNPWA